MEEDHGYRGKCWWLVDVFSHASNPRNGVMSVCWSTDISFVDCRSVLNRYEWPLQNESSLVKLWRSATTSLTFLVLGDNLGLL